MKKTIYCSVVLLFTILVSLHLYPAESIKFEQRVFKAAPLPGFPDELNRVGVNIYKTKNDQPILILVSGWTCTAAWFHYLSEYLSLHHGIEVWTVNRRQTFFEKRKDFKNTWKNYLTGKTNKNRLISKMSRIENFSKASLGILKSLGMKENIQDLHRVVSAAHKTGRPVFLGGWSDGVEYAMMYSLTSFGKTKGHSFLKGLVFLDENPEWGRFSQYKMKYLSRRAKLRIRRGNFVERRYPNVLFFEGAPLTGLKINPLAAYFRGKPYRGFSYSGKALTGWLFDGAGFTSRWGWLFSCGSLRLVNRKLRWIDGDKTDIKRIIDMHKLPMGVWEWFYPRKITEDYWKAGAQNFNIPSWGLSPDKENRLPIFSVFSGFSKFYGSLPSGISWYIKKTGISAKNIKVIKAYNFKHADILVSEKAEKPVWDELGLWIKMINVKK